MEFLGNTGCYSQKDYGLSLGNKSSDCYLINGLKDHWNYFKFFNIHSYKLQISLALWSLPETFFLPQKYHACEIFMTWHRNLNSVASCNFVYTFSGWPYPDISWPEINSFIFICKFYFQFQFLCYFCSEHWLALPNERRRRQRLESTEVGHRPIVCTYKLLIILNPVCKF